MLKKIVTEINRYNYNCIIFIESANGFYDLDSFNVKMIPASIEDLEKNHKARNLVLTDSLLDYYSLLDTISLDANHEIVGYKEEYFNDAARVLFDRYYLWKQTH